MVHGLTTSTAHVVALRARNSIHIRVLVATFVLLLAGLFFAGNSLRDALVERNNAQALAVTSGTLATLSHITIDLSLERSLSQVSIEKFDQPNMVPGAERPAETVESLPRDMKAIVVSFRAQRHLLRGPGLMPPTEVSILETIRDRAWQKFASSVAGNAPTSQSLQPTLLQLPRPYRGMQRLRDLEYGVCYCGLSGRTMPSAGHRCRG